MSTNANEKDPTVVVAWGRFSYLNCFEKKIAKGDTEGKYSVSLIIDDQVTIDQIKAAEAAAINKGISEVWGGKKPAKLKNMALKDGNTDRADSVEYADKMFVNAKSTRQPGVVDAYRNPIMSMDGIKSGDWGYVGLQIFPYRNEKGGDGLGVSFMNIMLWESGDPLGAGTVSAEDQFADIPLPTGEGSINDLL